MSAELARAIVRKFRGRRMVAEVAEDLLAGTGYELDSAITGLEAAGYTKGSMCCSLQRS